MKKEVKRYQECHFFVRLYRRLRYQPYYFFVACFRALQSGMNTRKEDRKKKMKIVFQLTADEWERMSNYYFNIEDLSEILSKYGLREFASRDENK
jgi:hypothetical protein